MEIGMINFWLGLLVTALTKETYFKSLLCLNTFMIWLCCQSLNENFEVKTFDLLFSISSILQYWSFKEHKHFFVTPIQKINGVRGRSQTTLTSFWPPTLLRNRPIMFGFGSKESLPILKLFNHKFFAFLVYF